jgi:hypothetical protein
VVKLQKRIKKPLQRTKKNRQGFEKRRKKSEFKVKRNLFEKTFAYRRRSAGIEHKISDFGRKRNSLTPRTPQLEAILIPR